MNRWRWLVALLILAFLGAWLVFDLGRYFDLALIKQQQQILQSWYADDPWRTALIFFLLYVLFTTTSVPGGAVMSLIAAANAGGRIIERRAMRRGIDPNTCDSHLSRRGGRQQARWKLEE